MTWKKRIISIALCLCALLCAASVRAEAADHSHPICGANHTDVGNHTSDTCSSQTWTAWDGTQEINNSSNLFKNTSKLYLYLSEDVTTSKNIIVPKNKTLYLCLNGYSLANIGQYESYTIQVDGTLVLCDCNSSEQNKGIITHGMRKNGTKNTGAGVAVYDGTFIMYGGKISNNASRGVDVNGGTFTMYGGEISGNTYTDNPNYNFGGGAGVRVRDSDTVQGNFAMYGGEISNNTYKGSGDGGGVYASGTGDFIIQGGTITDNQCSYNGTNTSNGAFGGGLHITGTHSELRIENSTISNNTCDGYGGGIFIGGDATGSITNCTISGNSATGTNSKGGGLTFQNSTFTLKGCTITDNKATGQGGAICLMTDNAYVTLSSGLNFSGNQDNCPADKSGNLTTGTANDVFLHTGAYLRLASDFSKTSTAPIVVTTYFTPSDNSYQKIAVDNRTTPDPTDFKYGTDSNSAIGIIAKTNNGKVELRACKHNYSTIKDATNHWQECSVCGDIKGVTAHSGGKASCTAQAVCQVCHEPYGELAAHDYDMTTWVKIDNDHHGHKCKNCNAINESTKAPHSWDNVEVTTPATCTADGERTYTCAVCSATKTEAIPATGHAWDTEWSKDNDHHWHKCKNANCTEIADQAEHSWDEGTVTTPATCTADGVKTLTCTVCSATKKETIPATGHAWDTEWSKDNDHHWHKCKNANCDAVKDKAEHDWDDGEVTTPATCTTVGEKTYTCTACSATKKETILATGHTPDAAVRENIVAATCTTAGSYDEVVYCTACRNEVSRTQKTIDKLAHDYDTTKWVKIDNDHHGHKCKNCDAITDLTAHVPGAAATETTPQLCTECGYVIAPATHPVHTWVFVAETPATCNAAGEREHYKCTCGRTSFKNGDVYDINEDASVLTIAANHTGNIGEQWHSDSANHWQEYTCCHARANETAHSGGAATCTAQAVCQVCGKAYGPLAAHAWQPATCTAPKTCTACHVTDGAALGHDWGAWKVTTPATKDAPGVETRTCAHNSAHTETRSIPKLSTAVYTVSEDTKIAQIEAKVDGLDKILESNENKALVNDGKSVGVSLTVKNTASSGVSEKIKEKLAGSNLVGLRLELTVEKTVTANGVVEWKQTILDAGVLLKTTITLPAELQGKSGYVVYRLHDGNVHVLTETANENEEFISVSADKTQITICARLYSEYVIAYQTGGSSGGGYQPVNPTPVKATSANTGDAGVLLYGVTAALSLTGTAWLGAKSRKH